MSKFLVGVRNCCLTFLLLLCLSPGPAGAGFKPSPSSDEASTTAAGELDASAGLSQSAVNVVENTTTTAQFMSLQDAINAASPGETLQFIVAAHAEGAQIVVPAGRTGIVIRGQAGGTTLTALANTGNAGDSRGWLLVQATGVTIEDMTFDGTGRSIVQAIRITATGASLSNCTVENIAALPASSYSGTGVVAINATISVTNCTFANINRIGVHLFGPNAPASAVSGCTMTGKGVGDWLDYGVEIGGGAVASLSLNTITNNLGVASSDGSTSAGVLITDFFAPGTSGTLQGNFINGCTAAIANGFLATDASLTVAYDNDLSGNAFGVNNAATQVTNASLNWWGSNSAATVAGYQAGTVDYTPWIDAGADQSGAPGFQADRSTLDVDDDSPQTGAVGRVQEGVNSVTASTVNILPGTYVEQVIINGMDVVLQGSGSGSTFIHAPAILASTFTNPSANRPVISAINSGDIRVRDLTVNGLGVGNANQRISGIAYWNAGGGIHDCHITAIRDTPISGNQYGVGVYCANNTGSYSLEVENVAVDDFQKNGMALTGNNMTVNVHDCTVMGAGDISFTAQNGIQVSTGAGGTIADCKVADIRFTPASFVASGILVVSAGSPVNVSGLNGANSIDDVQAPVTWYDATGSLDGIQVTGPMTSGVDYGPIFIANFTSLAQAAPAAGNRSARPASPFDQVAAPSGKLQTMAPVAHSVSVTNSCLDGGDVAGTAGVWVYSAGAPLSVLVSNSVLTDWDYGLIADGANASLTASENIIASNVTAGYDNTLSLAAQDAELNYWGHLSGPSGDGPGTGDAVDGAGIDFSPWLSNDNDSDPGCSFAPAGDNQITAGPGGCLSTVTTCLTVNVDINRTDAVPMRGYSVRVELSPELMLCGGTGSIVEGPYLSNVGGSTTNFQVVDNLDGSYTVDGVILGSPCGQAAATGTLFTVAVKRTVANGTGTITLVPLKARDCANAPLPVSPGPALNIDIDTTPPAAVSGLVSTQVKSGNDGDGTTKVDLAFTLPGDAASVQVYRAGFGNYPEYDDSPGAGAVPAVPAYPPGAPWVLTTVTASGQDDETANRDFWYYVAFCKDACGNVSAVSNLTGGTLNYHLGDVHNGFANCAGDNLVGTGDISFLGGNYGVALGVSDPIGCLDVGPTTDFSVDARPTTDNVIDFEDLIMFAINYNLVSKPAGFREPTGDRNAVALRRIEDAGEGNLLVVAIDAEGSGTIQGLSIDLAWNRDVVEPVSSEPGSLLGRQDRTPMILSARPGNVDVALLGAGGGISGSGELARMYFRVKSGGDPGIGIARITARDRDNQPVDVARSASLDAGIGVPRPTRLGAGYPNPFRNGTSIPFTIGRSGFVRLTVFDVLGRQVRTLIEGNLPSGDREVAWDGLDQSGARLASGQYMLRLESEDTVVTSTVRLVH